MKLSAQIVLGSMMVFCNIAQANTADEFQCKLRYEGTKGEEYLNTEFRLAAIRKPYQEGVFKDATIAVASTRFRAFTSEAPFDIELKLQYRHIGNIQDTCLTLFARGTRGWTGSLCDLFDPNQSSSRTKVQLKNGVAEFSPRDLFWERYPYGSGSIFFGCEYINTY